MNLDPCHASDSVVPFDARAYVRDTLKVRRVAQWCDVGESAVNQWLSRRAVDAPIPPDHIPAVVKGAREIGLEIPLGLLWPASEGVLSVMARPADEDYAQAKNFLDAPVSA